MAAGFPDSAFPLEACHAGTRVYVPTMKFPRLTRRRFLGALLVSAPVLATDAFGLEPGWVKTKTVRIGSGPKTHRFVHFTDLHFKGDANYLRSVIAKINALQPDFVCFTGDIIEQEKHLAEALKILQEIKTPLYGIPGNHDHWSGVDFAPIAVAFQATGGAWLENRQVLTKDGRVNLMGLDSWPTTIQPMPDTKNILLVHYPKWVEKIRMTGINLILAGHSHGGQVRIPFYGAVMTPYDTGRYEKGLFQTPAGPLYVNPGIGTFFIPIRFNCRPELTLFEI